MKITDLVGAASPLRDEDLRETALTLQLPVVRVQAVKEVESNGRGFHPETRRPIILFEPHIFHRRTGGKFSEAYPHVSYPTWGTHPYPAAQAQRYAQLAEAMTLDEKAALESTSWGMFQIMGFNYAACGFASVQAFVRAMCISEGQQLAAFAKFVARSAAMIGALRVGDWAGFARAYNGPGFAQHGYDQKLKAAAERLALRAS